VRPLPFKLKQIGVIRTPYTYNAPYQPVDNDEGDFRIVIDRQYIDGLRQLDKFSYIYVIYLVDRTKRELSMAVTPPWSGGTEVGVFASTKFTRRAWTRLTERRYWTSSPT